MKLKHLTARASGDGTAMSAEEFVALDAVESWTGRRFPSNGPEDRDMSGTPCRPGDVLFGKLRPYLAKVYLVEEDCVCASEFIAMRPTSLVDGRFLRYALTTESSVGLATAMSYGTKMPRVDPGAFLDMSIRLPDVSTQVAIADYLDSETARIDTLIDRKQLFIDLLLEKRTALITHAVTKGLDATVEMKDSGVKWIGNVPVRWGVGRLKDVAPYVTSGSRGWAQFYADEGPLFLRIANLPQGAIDLLMHDVRYVDVPHNAEGARTQVREGDVLISITAEMGAIAVVPNGLGEAYVSQHVALARPKPRVNGRWLAYVLSSRVGCEHYANRLYGGTKIQLSLNDVRETPIPMPPEAECDSIADYLDGQIGKLDALRDRTRRSIDLLREYRTALISAAVTGQIDIPGSEATEDVA